MVLFIEVLLDELCRCDEYFLITWFTVYLIPGWLCYLLDCLGFTLVCLSLGYLGFVGSVGVAVAKVVTYCLRFDCLLISLLFCLLLCFARLLLRLG